MKTFTMKSIFIRLLFISSSILFGQQTKNKLTKDTLTLNMNKSQGFINTYLNENKLYLEIKKEVLNKELLMVTRFSKLPSNYSGYINAGTKTAENVISFELSGNKILLKKLAYTNEANNEDPINKSVIINNFPPILAVFEIIIRRR